MTGSTYLDLGGALAAFGLIFAVYQLRKPEWELILKIRDKWQRDLFWVLGIVGLLLALVGVLVSYVLIPSSNTFSTPLIYDIAAYFAFAASPLSLIYFSTKAKGLFTAKNARKFYEVLIQELSRTNDDGINSALEVLLYNFDDICKAASERPQTVEVFQSAVAILDVVLSDESVVKILTTRRLDALQYIFSVIEKYNITRRESGIGIPKLVESLFCDRESFLYKHIGRDGLALSWNIYDTIFDSPAILTNFDLFGYPTLGYSNRKNISVGVFIEGLSRAIKTYLKTGSVPPRHINNGLSYLSEIFQDVCLNISIEEGRGVDTKYQLKEEWSTLSTIARFLGHDYPFLAYQEELNPAVAEREKIVPEASFYSDWTINAAIAATLYKAFEYLSFVEKKTDVYYIVLELLHGMIYESERKEGYRAPFEKRMWEQIGNNVLNRYYPAALRTYLVFIGFCLASDENQRQGWVGEQAERMRRLLYVDLKPLIDVGTEMVNKEKMKEVLLPQSMNYKDGNFTYTLGFGEGEIKTITPPVEGFRSSALEGVDLEHWSLL
jgi:hypothetical protein